MTTREEIGEWFDRGVAKGATHMVVACDTFDHEDYPDYVSPGSDVEAAIARIRAQPMTRIMEVYNLKMSKDEQLKAGRCYNL